MDRRPPLESAERLRERLEVTLSDLTLLATALTHKSYTNEHKGEGELDNERLEFLGDAVIDLAISHRLMERFPSADEGELSKLRALIVNEEGLAKVARELKLGELLRLGRGEDRTGGREKNSVLADALEAVLGAVYLGAGLDAVMALVDRRFGEALAGVAEGRNGGDFKTRLQERIQTLHKISPRYRVVSEQGPEHEKVFEVEVVVGGAPLAKGSGRSKRDAEQGAAKAALELLDTARTEE